MPGSDTKITCPNCGHEFELSEAIVSQLKEEMEKKYKLNIQEEKKKIRDSLEKELAQSYFDSMTELREQIEVAPDVSDYLANGYQPPVLETYADLQDILLLDPVHDVDETGWPKTRAE